MDKDQVFAEADRQFAELEAAGIDRVAYENDITQLSPEQQARVLAIVADERNRQAQAEFADWQEPMDKAKEDLKTRLAAIKGKWEEENSELVNAYNAAFAKAEEANKTIRDAIKKVYELQADKTKKTGIIPGWGVAIGEEMQFTEGHNEKTAVQWLIEHKHTEPLNLDQVKFKKLAEVLKPEFVRFVETVTVRVDAKKGK